MATRLYPPQLAGTLPAFYKIYDSQTGVLRESKIVIPFTMSAGVNPNEIKKFSLRMRTSSTNTFLFEPLISTDYDQEKSTVTFTLSAENSSQLNEGQYYKVQMAFISSQVTEEASTTKPGETVSTVSDVVGYYSTVGVIKCVQKPNLYIKGYSLDSINLFQNEIFGIYELSDDFDQTERVYSYNFSFYTDEGELYYTTGEILHNSASDIDYNVSIDSTVVNSFINNNEIYKLQYTVTTLNGLVVSSPMYRVTSETLLAPSKNLYILPEANNDYGGIKVRFHGLDEVVSYENVIQSLVPNSIEMVLDADILRMLKLVYWGSTENEAIGVSTVRNYADELAKTPENYNLRIALTRHFTDNINTLATFYNLTPGLLESIFNNSVDALLDFSTYLQTMVSDITLSRKQAAYKSQRQGLAIYVINTAQGYLYLEQVLKSRLESYEQYILDMINNSENLILTGKDQNFITTCQTIITTADLSIDVGKEFFSLLGFESEIEGRSEIREETYFGLYILARASEEEDYRVWTELKRFRLENARPSSIVFDDYTVKQGVKYIYSIQQYNMWGIYSSRLKSDPVSVDFEDIFLYDGERALKVKFNPKVTSFKTTILEQKTDTIGSKFPFIFRNGNVAYKEFPISGLISYQMDNELLFYDREIKTYARECTENKPNYVENMAKILENPCDLIENNIHLERDFKLEVLDWLNNGQPKLFRSGPEGNYIVRIMNVSMSPVDTLGRMLHSFTAQCAEIADFNYANLIKYGFIKGGTVNQYVSLWRSYYLNEYLGSDIVIKFDSDISYFSVQDLIPGTRIYLTYADSFDKSEEVIMIGITGAYFYEASDRRIEQIRIENTYPNKQYGILECQYKGIRYSDFDAITTMSLKTILSDQFVGVNPALLRLESLAKGVIMNTDNFRKLIRPLKLRYLLSDSNNANKEQLYQSLVNQGFEPGDIIQYINSSFYDGKKNKLRLLKLEQLHLKTRELIPIYAVPYDYVTQEGWDKLPETVNYYTGGSTYVNGAHKQPDGTFTREDYDEHFPSQNLLYSVTPFGTPYPIDRLTPVVHDYFNINDEFCVFQMFEWEPDLNSWLPTKRTNYFGIETDQYYDCYWNTVLSDYDTSYYIDEKYRYDKIDFDEMGLREDEQGYYITIGVNKAYFNDDLPLYIAIGNEYVKAQEAFIFQKNEFGNYKRIINDDSLIADKEYLYNAVRWNLKTNYHPVDDYYNEQWTPDENNIARSIVRSAELGPFYLRTDNEIKIISGDHVLLKNLDVPTTIKIGTGLIAEATFQLEVLDYLTESNLDEVKAAKEYYLSKANFLRNLYRGYEIIAEADSGFQRYLTLSRFYRGLLEGVNYAIPQENCNTYTSSSDQAINMQDKNIVNSILNIDKTEKNDLIYEYWVESAFQGKEKDQPKIDALIKKLQINRAMKEEMNLYDEEEDDLFDLVQQPVKEGVETKKAKIDIVVDELTADIDDYNTNNQETIQNYVANLASFKTSISEYNKNLQNYKAMLWLYYLMFKHFKNDMNSDNDNLANPLWNQNWYEDYVTNKNYLEKIKKHYNDVLVGGQGSASSIQEAKQRYLILYQNAFINARKALRDVQTIRTIINDRDDDSELDDYMSTSLNEAIFNAIFNFERMYFARRNYNRVWGYPLIDSDKNTEEFLNVTQDSYNFTEIEESLKALRELKRDDEAEITIESMFMNYYYDLINNKYNIEYNDMLNLVNENLNNSHKNKIIKYIYLIDSSTYVWTYVLNNNWKRLKSAKSYFDSINSTKQLIIKYQTSLSDLEYQYRIGKITQETYLQQRYSIRKTLSRLQDTLVEEKMQFQLRIGLTYDDFLILLGNYNKQVTLRNELLDTYIKELDNSSQQEILDQNNRGIIVDYTTDSVVDDNPEIYNSLDFDGKVGETVVERSDRLNRVSVLLDYIEKLENNINLTNWRQVVAEIISNIISQKKVCWNSGFDTVENGSAKDNIEKFNSILQDYQKEIKLSNNVTEEKKETFIEEFAQFYKELTDTQVTKGYGSNYLDNDKNTQIKFIIPDIYEGTTRLNDLDQFKEDNINSANSDAHYEEYLEYKTKFNTKLSNGSSYEDILVAQSTNIDDAKSITAINEYLTNLQEGLNGFVSKANLAANVDRYWPQVYNRIDSYQEQFDDGCNTLKNLNTSAIESAEDVDEVYIKKLMLYKAFLLAEVDLMSVFYFLAVLTFRDYEIDQTLLEFCTNNISITSGITVNNDPNRYHYADLNSTGIAYWYFSEVLDGELKYLNTLLDQAKTLQVIYNNKYDNYHTKYLYYLSKYQEYVTLYKSYLGTPEFDYYNKATSDDKDKIMRELIEEVKQAWYDFVLALDVGYKKEVQAGMYQ